MVYILVVGPTWVFPDSASCWTRFNHISTMDAPCADLVLAHAFMMAVSGHDGSSSPTGTESSFRFILRSHSRFFDLGDRGDPSPYGFDDDPRPDDPVESPSDALSSSSSSRKSSKDGSSRPSE
jgi:hypothetical protein